MYDATPFDMPHAYTSTVCVFSYPVPSPIRILLWKTDVCGYARSDCTAMITQAKVTVPQ